MQQRFGISIVLALATLGGANANKIQHLCNGILPINHKKIPVSLFSKPLIGGLTEAEFNDTIDTFEAKWKPVMDKRHEKLKVIRLWDDPTVNAFADIDADGTRLLNMFGGLARHKSVTKDAFMLVLCHEMGHHMGGAPKMEGITWASDEGQSDYYASLRCSRFVWGDDDNKAFLTKTVDKTLKKDCLSSYTDTRDQAICLRTGVAAKALADVFADPDVMGGPIPKFDTPDQTKVKVTSHDHPMPQCRLDTYFNGSLCSLGHDAELSATNTHVGTCNIVDKQANGMGLRPACWFADNEDGNIKEPVQPSRSAP